MDCGINGLTFEDPSLTQTQFAEDCDLSNIVRRFMKTGQLPATVSRQTFDSDADLPEDLQTLLNNNLVVQQRFDALPLEERNKYNNDPVTWLESLEVANEKEQLEYSTEGNSVEVSSSDPAEKTENVSPSNQ